MRPALVLVVIAAAVATARADAPPGGADGKPIEPPDLADPIGAAPVPDATPTATEGSDSGSGSGSDTGSGAGSDQDDNEIPFGVVTAEPVHEDNGFGPVIQIESIEITGNTATQTEIIRRALPISPGDVLHASDPRLRDARFKILALGYFRDVTLGMHKGSARGQVIVTVNVSERGTVVLNRLWFGTSTYSPWWLGTDVGERNLLGTGIAVGGGFVYAAHGDTPGATDQYAAEIRAAAATLRGTRWGALGSVTLVHGSEPYRVAGVDDDDAADFRAFSYRRLGGRVGVTYDLSALSRVSAGLRGEVIDTQLPVAPTQTLPDGRVTAVNLDLDPGRSRVVTVAFGFDHDTRPDPILPHAGSLLAVNGELGSSALGSSYDYATLFGRYEHWWPLFEDKHTIGVRLVGGVVTGGAPRFDQIYVADVDHMLTPRALGLVLATAAPINFLNTRPDKATYGELGGTAVVEYAARLFRGSGRKRVYGGDVFVGGGLWALANNEDLALRDTGVWRSLPVDLFLDAGVRIDTDVGVFELTISNALGRLPR